MAYCQIEDIQSFLPTIVGGTSSFPNNKPYPSPRKLDDADYTKIIQDVSLQMDQEFLKYGYEVPIDTTLSERIKSNLKRICVLGAASTILRRTSVGDRINLESAEEYKREFYANLLGIIECGLGPPYDNFEDCSTILVKTQPSKLLNFL